MSLTPPRQILSRSPISSTLLSPRINSQLSSYFNTFLSWPSGCGPLLVFFLPVWALLPSLLPLSCASIPLHQLPDSLVLECPKAFGNLINLVDFRCPLCADDLKLVPPIYSSLNSRPMDTNTYLNAYRHLILSMPHRTRLFPHDFSTYSLLQLKLMAIF